ncbi:MAG: glycosyltransferase [Desulfurococcaceae archaeon]|jgi:glycosyltransferase involved in cell wall biosynthesis|nr:glycosyltransferase [Desulfurococcaceae archaeon]
MDSKLNYVIVLLKAIASLRQMFERIVFNLNFEYHCRKLKEINDKPSISFVVPTRNEARYLPKLLTSINHIAQVCRVPIETIVVDYRSEDETPDIAKKMGAKVVEVDKPGVGYASYVGVLSAKGDIIIRTDADVIMTPSAIHETINVFMNDHKKLVATVGHIYYPLNLTTNLIAYLYDRYIRKSYNTTGYFIAFKKEVTSKLNFDPRLKANDDWDFGFRALKILGSSRLYYNYYVAVLVSSRLIKKKGYLKYLLENLGIIKVIPKPYSQL